MSRVVVLGGTGAVSEEVADQFVAGGGSAERVGLASGRSVDALAAGPAAGKAGYPLLLTGSPTDLGAATTAWLDAHAGAAITVIGGTSAVSAAAAARAGG